MDAFSDIWQYMPHGMCLLWKPWLVLLWAGSDALIFLSYFAIPTALLIVMKRRRELPHRGLIILFASFIMLCGITHLLSIVTLWVPIYPYVAFVKLATGLVSMMTAIVLFRLVPTLVSLPSPTDLNSVNEQLRKEILAHEETLQALKQAHASLEKKVEERTSELRETNDRMALLAREAVHRSRNLLTVVASLAQQSARGTKKTEDFIDKLLGRIQSLALATSTVLQGGSKTSEQLETVLEKQLEPLLLTFGDRLNLKGPSVLIGSEAAQQISLAVHELATNAQKYNLPNSDKADITIEWTQKPDDMFEFCWHENMAQVASDTSAKQASGGFGSKLLLRLVPAMLRGTARQTVEKGCLSYCLEIPAASLYPQNNTEEDEMLAARLLDESFGLS